MPPPDPRRPAAARWHDKALGDLAAARACLADEAVPAWPGGFHLQQAAEKTLKGLLVLAAQEPPRSHDLARLHELVAAAGARHPFTPEVLQALQPYAVEDRYPALVPVPGSREEVQGLLPVVEAAVGALAARLEPEEEAEARRRAEQEARRSRELDRLAARGEAAWAEVETLVSSKKARGYDSAVRLLKDLRDLAVREGSRGLFSDRLGQLRERHGTKHAFLRRLREAGL